MSEVELYSAALLVFGFVCYCAGRIKPRSGQVPIAAPEPPSKREELLLVQLASAKVELEKAIQVANEHTIEWKGWPTKREPVWIEDETFSNREYTNVIQTALDRLRDDLQRYKPAQVQLHVRMYLGYDWVKYFRRYGQKFDDSTSFQEFKPAGRRFEGQPEQAHADLIAYLKQPAWDLANTNGSFGGKWVVRLVVTVKTLHLKSPPKKPTIKYIEVPILVPQFVPVPLASDEQSADEQGEEAAQIAARLEVDTELRTAVQKLLACRSTPEYTKT